MQGAVKEADFKLDRVVRRQGIPYYKPIVHRAADGFWFIVVAQAMEAGVEGHGVVKHKSIGGTCRNMRAKQGRLHKNAIFTLQVIDHHIIIMCVTETERRQRVAVVKAEVAVAIGIGERDDAFATESAVGVHQIGEALVCDLRLDGIFHRFLAGAYHQQEGT